MTITAYCKLFFGPDLVPAAQALGCDPVTVNITMDRKTPSELTADWNGLSWVNVNENPYLKEDVLLTWEMGFSNGESLTDVFVIKQSKRKYDDAISVTITAKDKLVGLAEAVSTKVWVNVRASDVALDIARELGLQAQVLESEIVYPTLSAAGRTYGQILRDLSMDEDFNFWIKDQSLFFGPINLKGSPNRTLSWNTANALSTGLVSFTVDRDAVAKVAGENRATATKGADGKAAKTESKFQDSLDQRRDFTVNQGATGGYDEKLVSTFTKTKEVNDALIGAIATTNIDRKVESAKINEKYLKDKAALDANAGMSPTEKRAQLKKLEAQKKDEERTLAQNAQNYAKSRQAAGKTLVKVNQDFTSASEKVLKDPKLTPDQKAEQIVALKTKHNENLDNIRKQLLGQSSGKKVADPKLKGEVLIERMPSEDANAARIRNEARARMVRWKGLKITGELYGLFIKPRQKILIDGVASDDTGPWLINHSTFNWSDGDIAVSFEGAAEPVKKEPPKKKGAKNDPPKTDATVEEVRDYSITPGSNYKETQKTIMDFGGMDPMNTKAPPAGSKTPSKPGGDKPLPNDVKVQAPSLGALGKAATTTGALGGSK